MTNALIDLFRTRDASVHSRMRDTNGFIRVRHGVYSRQAEWESLPDHERYRHRVLALAAVSPDAVFSHESAAVLHGLPLFGEPRDLHVFAEGRTRTKRALDVLLHTSENPRDVVDVDGLRATSLCATAVDLGRVLAPAASLAVWDAAMRRGATVAELTGAWVHQTNSRGTRTLVWLGNTADGRCESPGESVSRAVMSWLGFAAPELQVDIPHANGVDRPDFLWPDEGVIGEFDGHAKYEADAQHPMDVLRREKSREDRLRRRAMGFARWTFTDLTHPDRLRDILRAAGLREIRPPDAMMLRTLSRLFVSPRHL